ncbi:PP2C family protein-serine/threonine phosphatase [Streptomyces sp. NPDC004610]|uniref:PP2C family protein-serine/threonine phosphatase n=1 Tax=unclassified Streptomyces TaxID=2593676 RepID=UPI0033A63188
MRRVRGLLGHRNRDERDWLRGAEPPRWVRVLPVALFVVVTAATLISRDALDIGFLLGAIPPLTVLSYGPLATAVMGGLVVTVLNVPRTHLNQPGNTDLLALVFVVLLSVFVSYVRSHRDAQLITERAVGEAVQRAVVPPLPERVGRIGCFGLYRAAQRGTLVGGDFFDVRDGPYGVRAVMADVQGHGLGTVPTVVSLLGAFREAVLDQRDLAGVASRMDRRLTTDAPDPPDGPDAGTTELFATAALLEFAPDARSVRIVVRGHPPPLLLRDGRVREIGVPPGLPLGIAALAGDPPKEITLSLEPGDHLFLASDGVWEARDDSGAYYPLRERLLLIAGEVGVAGEGGDVGAGGEVRRAGKADAGVAGEVRRAGKADVGAGGVDPDALMAGVWADLVERCGEVGDDVTMLVLVPGVGGEWG